MQYFTKKRVIYGTEESEHKAIAVDDAGRLKDIIYGTKDSGHKAIVVDDAGRLTEAIYILKTVSTTHFTEAIAMNAHETENITGLEANKVYIRGVNIQSIQNLKFLLILWSKDTFGDTAIDTDSYLDDVELDMTSSPAFRIDAANQYYLNVSGLGIIYEDEDASNEMHISLQNLSAVAKLAGTTGAVQMDVLYTLRN